MTSKKWLYGVVFEDAPDADPLRSETPPRSAPASGITITDGAGQPVATARVLVDPTAAELELAGAGDADPGAEPDAQPAEERAPALPASEAPAGPAEQRGEGGGEGGGEAAELAVAGGAGSADPASAAS